MYPNRNSFADHNSRGMMGHEAQSISERISTIENQLNQLTKHLVQQQHFYQQLKQAHLRHPNQGMNENKLNQQLQKLAEAEKTQLKQPEPGVPPEQFKLPEEPRSVYIPPGVNGIIRM